jgi:transposase
MLFIGIDQSKKKYDVHIMNESSQSLAVLTIKHNAEGFRRLHEQCGQFQEPVSACLVAIESAYSMLVDYLLDRGYPVYVIPGKAVNRYRDRHRQSRSVSDQGDAIVLSHVLRTDRHLYSPLEADLPLTRQICSQVRLLQNLKRSVLRFCNQLRALLWRYYPLASELFSGLDQQITLHFIQTYPTLQDAQRLTRDEFTSFCREHHYRRSDLIVQRYGQLSSAPAQANAEVAKAYAPQAQALARVLCALLKERQAASKSLHSTFQQHPDAHIFQSLPGAGEFLAPALLSKFRDCRARFPSAEVAQAIAGTSPVTIQSGKKRRVRFRVACDREFRFFATQFARCSTKQSSWAAAYFVQVRPRYEKISHAYRALANRWIPIIWRMWVDRVDYDEAIHLRNRHAGRKPC